MPVSIKLGAKLHALTALPVLLSSGLICWALSTVAEVDRAQIKSQSAQQIIFSCRRLQELITVDGALQSLCDKTGDPDWQHDLQANKLQQSNNIDGIKKDALLLPGDLPRLAARFDSTGANPDEEVKLLSEIEAQAKMQLSAGEQQLQPWQLYVAKNITWLSACALTLSLLASLGLVGIVIARTKSLRHLVQRIDLRKAKQLMQAKGDEISQLSAQLAAYKVQLTEAFKQEKAAAVCLTDMQDGQSTNGQDVEKIRQVSRTCTNLLMDMMPAGLFVLSEDGSIRFSNSAATHYVGKSSDELMGKPFVHLLAGTKFDSPAAFVDLMRRRSWSYVVSVACGSVAESRVQMWMQEFSRRDGEELFLLVMLDYTDDQKFKELQQRLVAMVAHDIATPLSTVHGVLEMTTTGMFGALYPELQDELIKSAADCSQILKHFKNLVRFEKLVSKFSSLSGAQLSLSDLTDQALQTAQSSIAEKGLTVSCAVEPRAAALGDADELALLGAKLLQIVVEYCKEKAAIEIHGTKEQIYVSWTVVIADKGEMLKTLQPYLEKTDAFEIDEVSENLDVALWRLLVQQTGTILAGVITQRGSTITLRLPAAQREEMPSYAHVK